MSKSNIKVPANGEKITYKNNKLVVPDNPIIPYIEGDGIGVDITPVMLNVIDAAVEKAYDGKRKISWMEIYCGEKSVKIYGDDEWLPDETLQTCKDYKVSIKGPSDFVSNADKKAEKIIIEELSKSRKNFCILSEEIGVIQKSDKKNFWIIGQRSNLNWTVKDTPSQRLL